MGPEANLGSPRPIAYDGTQDNIGDEFWVTAGDRGDLSYVGVR